jgi:Domain of Unknown Function with PDB structure (DUF3857)
MFGRISLALMVSLMSSVFVAANAADTQPGDRGWQQTAGRYDVSFDERGRSTIVFDFEIQAVDDRGAEAISRQVFPYNSELNELTATDLATVKADGRLIAVDDRAVRDQPVSAESSSSHLDEQRRKTIVYSQVAAGDRIRGRLIYKAKGADFAGEFADDGGAFAERRDRAEAGVALAAGLR